MNYNVHLQKSHRNPSSESKHSKTKSKEETPCSLSNYSTCSDTPQSNMYSTESQVSRESVILAGHLVLNETESNSVLDETNFSISSLDINKPDLNVAICSESSDDVYSDCRDFNNSNSSMGSTMYMNVGQIFNSREGQSDLSNNNSSSSQTECQKVTAIETEDFPPVIGTIHERLLTIIEEKESTNTTDYIVKGLSPTDSHGNTGRTMAEMVDQMEIHEEQNNNITRKVLFLDLDNEVDDQNNKLVSRKTQKTTKIHPGLPTPKKPSDTCNHNTTESFILWEKFCETSEKLPSRRSFSFTQLNVDTESCSGDDEYSTISCKTVDDMQLSKTSVEKDNYSASYQHKGMYKSKSCESILQEAKHLPHLLYDRFLKCLAKEVERIRKENVVCTCQKYCKNNYNKENQRKRSPRKSPVKLTNRIINTESGVTESRLPLRVGNHTGVANQTRLSPRITNGTRSSPAVTNKITNRLSPRSAIPTRLSPEAANRTRLSPGSGNQPRLSPETGNRSRLSPEAMSRNLSQFQTSPISPMKTTPSKTRYFWNKEIVSPVGEYIRGKRQSPFQSSPRKKK